MNVKEREAILYLLEDAENSGFYGEIIFKYRDGKIYNIIKGESLKLEDLLS